MELKRGNGEPDRKLFYEVFGNTFYYGEFEYPKGSGDWYEGKHKAMITKDEFNKAQRILNSSPKKGSRGNNFKYRGN